MLEMPEILLLVSKVHLQQLLFTNVDPQLPLPQIRLRVKSDFPNGTSGYNNGD